MMGLSRRTYHSPRREAAARETRRAVFAAARQAFAVGGYEGTTLATIARAAGVSLATVKLVEPTKSRLLVGAIEDVVRSDDTSLPLVEQAWWRDLVVEPDAARLLGTLAGRIAGALERQADLLEVVRQAARSEPELARLEERGSLGRRADLGTVVAALAARGDLRADLSAADATDALWAIASPQLYALLVRRGGWTSERWAVWLGDSLVRLLIRGQAPAATL